MAAMFVDVSCARKLHILRARVTILCAQVTILRAPRVTILCAQVTILWTSISQITASLEFTHPDILVPRFLKPQVFTHPNNLAWVTHGQGLYVGKSFSVGNGHVSPKSGGGGMVLRFRTSISQITRVYTPRFLV